MTNMDDTAKSQYTTFIANQEYFEQLSETRPQLRDLLDDHRRLLEAVAYWEGRSDERVAEFFHLALDLEEEILEFTRVTPDKSSRV
jgi:hypothetical protein